MAKTVCKIGGHTPGCAGAMLLVLGVLIVLNDMNNWFTWGTFIGALIALKGILMFIHPCCK